MTQDLLFELGCEELPSALVSSLAQELLQFVLQAFAAVDLSYGHAQCFATPRRLAFIVYDVPRQLPERIVIRRGPKKKSAWLENGEPSSALLGFARSCGVSWTELSLQNDDHYEYRYSELGQTIEQFIPSCILESLTQLTIPKPMRWGDGRYSFARPVHWAVLLYGQTLIDAEFFGLQTTRATYGHRFLHPEAIELAAATDYVAQLKAAYVLPDFEERKLVLIKQVETLMQQGDYWIPLPKELIHEITAIVEWPLALLANFEQQFLSVPAAVLIASMQQHQKCLPVYNQSRVLLPHFVAVSNGLSVNLNQVRQGNEKVMHARLSDAMFFYQQDRQRPLVDYASLCEQVVFEQRLGTLVDKNQRVLRLALFLAKFFAVSEHSVRRVVELSKCDLMTGLVGEFPELQGTIGQLYALADGEDEAVSCALFEQYLPRFAADVLPTTQLGWILSLAERLDTLMGIFAIGLKPSGEKDPYKLRRHALAVVRLLLDKKNDLQMDALLELAREGYAFLKISPSLVSELKQFMIERMQSYYVQKNFSLECFHAAVAVQNNCWYDLSLRLQSYVKFKACDAAQSLQQSARRVGQMLLSKTDLTGVVNPSLLIEPCEQQLWKMQQKVAEGLHTSFAHQDYDLAFESLALLSQPLSNFFEHVLVMTEDVDLSANRLNLLMCVQNILQSVVLLSS